MKDQWPQLGAGGALTALFLFVLRLMGWSVRQARDASDFVRSDRDECLERLDAERAARERDRERCDAQLDAMRERIGRLERRLPPELPLHGAE